MAQRSLPILDRDRLASAAQREMVERERTFVERDHQPSSRRGRGGDSAGRVNVQCFATLDAVAADAAAALDRAAQARLYDRLDWYRLTLAHIAPAGRPRILRARSATAAAWLFLAVERGRAHALASWYTLRFDAVRTGADDGAILRLLAAALPRHRISRLALSPLADDALDLAVAFRAAGWRVALTETSVNWQVDVAAGWDAYWRARPGRLRETVRRKGRRDPFRLVILGRFDATAWDDYEAVYRQSWKPQEGSPAFLRALAEQEGAAGTLRLGLAYDGERPVAAQFWLVENGTATIHKLAHTEADKARSPGTLLTAALFRHVIELDHVATVDFGTGDDPYKADWMDHRRPLWRLDAWFIARPRGLAGWLVHRTAQLVRRRSSG